MNSKLRTKTRVCSFLEQDADKLLKCGDANAALLYIAIIRHEDLESSEIQKMLGMTNFDFTKALQKLTELNLISGEVILPASSNELPEYTAEDIVTRSKEDEGFKIILNEAQSVLGHTLSAADLRILFGIYDNLGLPIEVILMLLNHSLEDYAEKFGAGRKPSMRGIEKTAYYWANREINTLEAVDEYLAQQKEKNSVFTKLRHSFSMRDRDFTQTERKYIEDWLELGFTVSAIETVYDRTVTNLGSFNWKYADKIMSVWHEKNLHTSEEIAKGDKVRGRYAADTQENSDVSSNDELLAIYDKIKNGKA